MTKGPESQAKCYEARRIVASKHPALALRARSISKVFKDYPQRWDAILEPLTGRQRHCKKVALNGVSFELHQGEALGVIGDNGAGKSTLLRILAGTAFPTSGSVEATGRVAALLDLSAGLHPQFTGRENVMTGAALLGLDRRRTIEELGAIMEFAELGHQIDWPLREYSTGMIARLGFAIATCLAPAVLVVDEVLAVGDQAFQHKCLKRMADLLASGTCLVFCSHDLAQVSSVCNRAIWLNRGQVQAEGDASHVIETYRKSELPERHPGSTFTDRLRGRECCRIDRVLVVDSREQPRTVFRTGDTLQVDIQAFFSEAFACNPGVAVAVVRENGMVVFITATSLDGVELRRVSETLFAIRLVFPDLRLGNGRYYLNVSGTDEHSLQAYTVVERAATFQVCSLPDDRGLVTLDHGWLHISSPNRAIGG